MDPGTPYGGGGGRRSGGGGRGEEEREKGEEEESNNPILKGGKMGNASLQKTCRARQAFSENMSRSFRRVAKTNLAWQHKIC